MGFGKVRFEGQSPPETCNGFVQVPLGLQGIAQVVVGFNTVWLEGQSPLEAFNRFIQVALGQ